MILPLTTLAGLIALLLIYHFYLDSGEPLFRDISAYANTMITAWTKFGLRAEASAQSLLEFTSREDATIAAIGGLAVILGMNICRAILWPYVAVLAWGAANKLFDRIAPRDRALINSHLLICLIYLALFLFTKRFMLERYSGIFTLYMLLYLSFILNTLWTRGKNHLGKALVILLLLGMSLDSTFNSEYKKAFIGDAIEWVTANTPEDVSLVTNNAVIGYFSGRKVTWRNVAHEFKVIDLAGSPKLWRESDYLVILMKRGERTQWRDFLADNSLQELKAFTGQRGSKVGIVKIR
jgi:hypothetical protein